MRVFAQSDGLQEHLADYYGGKCHFKPYAQRRDDSARRRYTYGAEIGKANLEDEDT
jgi:hypothetical protein